MKQKDKFTTTRKAVYRQLRYHITFFSALLTGLVLLAACIVSFRAAQREIQDAALNLFLSQCQTVNAYLATPGSVDTQGLLQFVEQNDLTVAVVDGGTLLKFTPTLSDDTWNSLLLELQKGDVWQKLNSSKAESEALGLTALNENWRVSLQNHFTSTTQWFNVLVLQPVATDSRTTLRLVVQYSLIFFASWSILIAIAGLLSRRMVQPVEEAQNEQLRFLASASHELKTPLAVISTSVDLLLHGTSGPEDPCRTIQHEARQMARLIDDMLVLTNGGTGRWRLSTESIAPEDVSMSVYEKFAPVFARKKQKLNLEIPDTSLPFIWADEQRLEQILSILLDNAQSYAPSGSSVLLRVDQQNGKVRFWVIDHGNGIPDSEKQTIFGYFYRSNPNSISQNSDSVTRHYGLGLSVAAELTRLHQGTLTVQDTPGGGASFCLMLPSVHNRSRNQ